MGSLILFVGFGLASDVASARPRQAAVASVTLDVPTDVLIGTAFEFTVTFDNTDPTDTGYGPFIDIIFPSNGVDGTSGTSTPDGIDFVEATYLGQTITATGLIFPAGGCVDHPYARMATNTRVQVCGIPGDTLVVLALPFGSFTATQPAAEITVTAIFSNLADLNIPLNILARGGFQFGNDPLNNPCCDASILTPNTPDGAGWPSAPVNPVLMLLTKTTNRFADGTIDETVTGPNFPGEYTISIDVADGQTITDLDVIDSLPNNLAFVGVISATPGGITTTSPPIGVPSNPPNNQLIINFALVTGGPGTTDVEVVWEYFVADVDANGNLVVDPATGTPSVAENQAQGVGDWQPLDPRDTGGTDNATTPGGAAPEHTLILVALGFQKQVDVVVDTGAAGPTPGDTLEYTLGFEISDFFTFGDLLLTDVFSDGQRFDITFTPTFSVTDRAGTVNGTFTVGGDLTVDISAIGNDPNPATDGSTRLVFDISAALIGAGSADGILQGGRATLPDSIGATGTLIYRTVIQEAFSDTYPSGGPNVDLGDRLNNEAELAATIRDNTTITTVLGALNESTDADIELVRGEVDKSIYAINGTPCTPCATTPLDPGDTVTYRIGYILPTSDFDALTFTDFLPLPVFNATTLNIFDATVSAAPPPSGTAKFGPLDTFFALSSIVPGLTTNAADNTVTFNYGRFSDPANTTTQIELLFTVTILNNPFANGLFLNNQVRAAEGSTNVPAGTSDAIASLNVGQPFLVMRKGVVAASNPNATFTLPIPPGVFFSPPASAGTPWTGLINSTGLAGNDINSDLNNAAPGDLVTFAIVIENVGAGSEGAFDIRLRDNLTPGFIIPSGSPGLNLKVTRGDGTPMTFTALGPSGDATDLFATGIELTDPGPDEGVCQTYDPASGANIVLVTYDLQIDPAAAPSGIISNLGQLTQYGSDEGLGSTINLVSDAQLFRDSASVGLGAGAQTGGFDIALTKVGVLEPGGLGLVGENLNWVITITNIGTVPGTNIVISDVVEPELAIAGAEIDRGTASVNGQLVTFTIPILGAGESVEARIFTVIQSIPADGVLNNTVTLTGTGANGSVINRSASGAFNTVTGLPTTGYPPDEITDPMSQIEAWDGLLEVLGLGILGVGLLLLKFRRG